MDRIGRRNNSPETIRLVGLKNAVSRAGTLRDHQSQKTVFAPSRPNRRSREEIAKIDAELMQRANWLEEHEESQEEGGIGRESEYTEEKSIRMWRTTCQFSI